MYSFFNELYFSLAYPLNISSVILATYSAISLSDCSKKIAEIVKIVKENKIPVILKLEQGNSSVAKEIAKETGAVVKNFNSCHNCTEEEFKKGETFLGLFKRNLKTLKEAVGLLWI